MTTTSIERIFFSYTETRYNWFIRQLRKGEKWTGFPVPKAGLVKLQPLDSNVFKNYSKETQGLYRERYEKFLTHLFPLSLSFNHHIKD